MYDDNNADYYYSKINKKRTFLFLITQVKRMMLVGSNFAMKKKSSREAVRTLAIKSE
jgi:hypothetical protein